MSSTPAASDPRSRIPTPVAEGVEDRARVSGTRRGLGSELGMVAGRYRLLSRIAEGGMGVVYKAEHVLSRKKLALKILHPHLCHGRQAVERFRREVSAAAEIDHPGIVQVFDAGVDNDGSFYMAMELLEGESLGTRSRRDWPGTRTAVELITGMCGPLARAHEKGFVHRDLKPDNVFIALDQAGGQTVKLLDFGLVREVQRRGPTQSGITFGTPEYMAPEQAMSAKKANVEADVWSVGVMLYELLAGRHPFTGETANAVMANVIKEPHPPLSEVAPHVPRELVEVIERCLEKDAARRPENAGALKNLLCEVAARVELDEQRPANPVLRSHSNDDEEADGLAERDSIFEQLVRQRELDENGLLSVALAPVPALLQAGERTEPRRGREGQWARRGAWAAMGVGAGGLLGVIAWALTHRGAPEIVATPLPEIEPASEVVVAPEPPPVVETVIAPAPPQRVERAAPAPPVRTRDPLGEAPQVAPPAAPEEVIEPPAEVASEEPPRARRAQAEDEPSSALAEAQACLQRGDTRCAVAALQDARSASEMSLLIDIYRMQGRTADARELMQRYLRRFPRGQDADEYRGELGITEP